MFVFAWLYTYVCTYVHTVWRETLAGETLANLANDHEFAKFEPAKFYALNRDESCAAVMGAGYIPLLDHPYITTSPLCMQRTRIMLTLSSLDSHLATPLSCIHCHNVDL